MHDQGIEAVDVLHKDNFVHPDNSIMTYDVTLVENGVIFLATVKMYIEIGNHEHRDLQVRTIQELRNADHRAHIQIVQNVAIDLEVVINVFDQAVVHHAIVALNLVQKAKVEQEMTITVKDEVKKRR
jgi:hypothetical protein